MNEINQLVEYHSQWEQAVITSAEDCVSNAIRLYDTQFSYTSKGARIQIFIDKLDDEWGSPNIEDCEQFSRLLHLKLESLETLQGSPEFYVLEVSSPGAERPVRSMEEFSRFQKLPIKLQVLNEDGKRKDIVVQVLKIEESSLKVSLADVKFNRNQGLLKKKAKAEEFTLNYSDIIVAKLRLDF